MARRSQGPQSPASDGDVDREIAGIVQDCYLDLLQNARKRIAREPWDNSLTATPLLHEAAIRVLRADVPFRGPHHFFALTTRAMERTLIDRARRRHCPKRGGGQQRVPLSERPGEPTPSLDCLALNEALALLAVERPGLAQVVAFRYFGGMTVHETAERLNISPRAVDKRWKVAKAWLRREMTRSRLNRDEDDENAAEEMAPRRRAL